MSNVYGWQRDRPDFRDHRFSISAPIQLPKFVDLRHNCPAVYDQGQLGSCTANAIAAAVEFDHLKQGLPDFMPSRLFIYYNERAMANTVSSDAGAQIRDGVKVINTMGVCPESDCPYIESQFAIRPSQTAYDTALLYQSVLYESIDQNLNQLKQCLASGFPFVFGFSVYDSFETDQVAQTGVMLMPQNTESCIGGHAVLAVGYDDTDQVFIVRNSWGDGWGVKGYFYMPYSYISNSSLASDFWKITLVK